MSSSSLKTRHYAALSSRLRSLRTNLSETEIQLDALAIQLQAMSKLGASHGAQFMAVSRLLDVELDETAKADARASASAQEALAGE